MKENLILVNYKVESEAYQALSELKRETSNANYTISQAAIVKKENGTLNIMDGFVNGAMTGDDTWKGYGRYPRRPAWRIAGRQYGYADRRRGGCQ